MEIRKQKIKSLFLILIITQIMIHFITPLFINYFFDETTRVGDNFFALLISFTIPLLGIILVSYKKNDFNDKIYFFDFNDSLKVTKNFRKIIITIIIALLLSLTTFYLSNFFEVIYVILTNDYSFISVIEKTPFVTILINIAIFGLFHSIFEEILYRKMYHDTFIDNKLVLYIMSVGIFFLAHDGLFTTFSSILLGFLSLKLFLKEKSLFLCILMHFSYNFFSIIFNNTFFLPFKSDVLLRLFISKTQIFGVISAYIGLIGILGFLILRISNNETIYQKEINAHTNLKFTKTEKTYIFLMIIISILFYLLRNFF